MLLHILVTGLAIGGTCAPQGRSAEPAKILENLEQLKDIPVLTGKLTIDAATHNPINQPCVVETVQGGRTKFVKTVTKIA